MFSHKPLFFALVNMNDEISYRAVIRVETLTFPVGGARVLVIPVFEENPAFTLFIVAFLTFGLTNLVFATSVVKLQNTKLQFRPKYKNKMINHHLTNSLFTNNAISCCCYRCYVACREPIIVFFHLL